MQFGVNLQTQIIPREEIVKSEDHIIMVGLYTYPSQKYHTRFEAVFKHGFTVDEALLEKPPRDSIHSEFVCYCKELNDTFLDYFYFTVHDASDPSYEIYAE